MQININLNNKYLQTTNYVIQLKIKKNICARFISVFQVPINTFLFVGSAIAFMLSGIVFVWFTVWYNKNNTKLQLSRYSAKIQRQKKSSANNR